MALREDLYQWNLHPQIPEHLGKNRRCWGWNFIFSAVRSFSESECCGIRLVLEASLSSPACEFSAEITESRLPFPSRGTLLDGVAFGSAKIVLSAQLPLCICFGVYILKSKGAFNCPE